MRRRWPEKLKKLARGAVRSAIARGQLAPPNKVPCVDCGKIWQPGAPGYQYDHFAGYDRPNWLRVHALCPKDHHARGEKAQRTQCPKGHAYTPANTLRNSRGNRACRRCANDYDRRRRKTTRGPSYWRDLRARRKAAS